MFNSAIYLNLVRESGVKFQILNHSHDQLLLQFHVLARPGSKKNNAEILPSGEIKVALAAPPIDGKANEELCIYLSELFGVSKRCLELSKGLQSKVKKLIVNFSQLSLEKEEKRMAKCLAFFSEKSLS